MDSRRPVLLLADFEEGKLKGLGFAMKFLHESESPFYILQTYQNINFGRETLQNILPILKEITKNELKSLKTHLIEKYNIKKKQIKLLALNGELISILRNEIQNYNNIHAVLGINGRFGNKNNVENNHLKKIIENSTYPLFILSGNNNNNTFNNILYVSHTFLTPSSQVIEKIKKICSPNQAVINILLVGETNYSSKKDDIQNVYNEHFNELNFKITYSDQTSFYKSIKSFEKDNPMNLIIINKEKN